MNSTFPSLTFLLFRTCVSEPQRVISSCVILVTAVAAGVVYAGVPVLVGFLLSLTVLLVIVNILSSSVSTLTEQQDKVLKSVLLPLLYLSPFLVSRRMRDEP
ncbi:hypothetical protein Cva_00420 [Caedimonas varicaedens]|jgi:hypothetical protein|uniref:Uncharacterized protein n=1 Tax=Caedimonas varicaedens TaxID=1629334 RepID=A0A0K8MB78_9PROT|nr:hypothetical protein Cva_00420 [Caedimonas varicaedens]